MSAPKDTRRFLLSLRDADPAAGLLEIRLRRALKCLLRSFGLRCERAELHVSPPPPGDRLAESIGTGEALPDGPIDHVEQS